MTKSYEYITNTLLLVTGALLVAANFNFALGHAEQRADFAVAHFMNGLLGHFLPFDLFAAYISTAGGDILVLCFIWLLMAIHAKKAPTQQQMIKRLAYWISTLLLILVISIVVDAFPISRTIPLHTLHNLFDVRSIFGVVLRTDPYSCYPSGHTLAYSLLVLMAFKRYPKMGVLFLIMALLMLPIRLVLGIHWITDMLLGSLPLALLINAVIWKVAMLHNFSVTERAMVFAFQQIPRRTINK